MHLVHVGVTDPGQSQDGEEQLCADHRPARPLGQQVSRERTEPVVILALAIAAYLPGVLFPL